MTQRISRSPTARTHVLHTHRHGVTHAQFMSLLGRRASSSDDHELYAACTYDWLRFRRRHRYRPFSDDKYHGQVFLHFEAWSELLPTFLKVISTLSLLFACMYRNCVPYYHIQLNTSCLFA